MQRLRTSGAPTGIGRDKNAEKLMKDRRNSPDGGEAVDKEGCKIM